jgi:hypothetical protein
LLILLSILGGLEYFGLMGLIAGPVVFSITATLVRILKAMIEEQGAAPAVPPSSSPGAPPPAGSAPGSSPPAPSPSDPLKLGQ